MRRETVEWEAPAEAKTVRLKTPVMADLEGLEIGNVVYLDSRVFTGREGAPKAIAEGRACRPTRRSSATSTSTARRPRRCIPMSFEMGAVTATASAYFTQWLDRWFEISGCKLIIGKGGACAPGLPKFVPNGALYLTTVDYGTGALLGRGIKEIVAAHWPRSWASPGPCGRRGELRLPGRERSRGNSLFERENAEVAQGLGSSMKAPARPSRNASAKRTREDEVI